MCNKVKQFINNIFAYGIPLTLCRLHFVKVIFQRTTMTINLQRKKTQKK